MIEPEIDMDELEARLYGQVHYMPSDYDILTPTNIPNTHHVKTFTRYFDQTKPQHLNTPNFVPPKEVTNISPTDRNIDRERVGVYPVPVVSSPINNIVLLQPSPTQIYTDQQNSQKWLQRLLQQYKQAQTKKNKRRRVNRKAKLKSQKQRLQSAENLDYININNDSFVPTKSNNVPKNLQVKKEVYVISDDDSSSSADSSDVILVETKSEIINIDCDETDRTIISSRSMENLDIESTTSNDFLDNTLIPNTKSSTPVRKNDIPETGSGRSSTMDYTENFKGTPDAAKHPSNSTFSELNLDSFTNYIESSGKKNEDILPLQSSLRVNKLKKTPVKRKSTSRSSDSSSESEYDSSTEKELRSSGKNGIEVKQSKIELDVISIDDSQLAADAETESLIIDDSRARNEMTVIEITESENRDVIVIDDEKSLNPEEINDNLILNVDDSEEIKNTNMLKNTEREGFSKYWTDDMDKFYNKSWGQENYSVVEQQRQMSDDPSMWKIIAKDRMNPDFKAKEPRCNRCREFGHIAIRCTKKLGPLKCIICGIYGHSDTRCPNKICTSCGQRNSILTTFCSRCASIRYVRCTICHMTGHLPSHCTDLWRRYLFTTKEGALQQPTVVDFKPAEDRWCSGCGSNGHYEPTCHYYNRTHNPASFFIHSYENIYKNQRNSSHDSINLPSTSQVNMESPKKNTKICTKSKVSEKNQDIAVDDDSETRVGGYESWCNNEPMYHHLLKKDAGVFLSVLQNKTSVYIYVTKKEPNSIVCHFKGATENVLQAKEAITRYCFVSELPKQSGNNSIVFNSRYRTMNCLNHNLDLLNNIQIDWFTKAHKLYKTITVLTTSRNNCRKPKAYRRLQNKLNNLYQKLNTIIIGILKIGDGKTHMDNLEQSLQTGRIALHSFDYVFHSDHRLYSNYEELISKLPSTPCDPENNTTPLKVENLKLASLRLCKKLNMPYKFKKILKLYAHVIITNYSSKHLSVFGRQCSIMKKMNEKGKKK